MKKLFTLCLIFCAFSIVSQAQIRLGVKGGGNLAYSVFDPEISFDVQPLLGFHLGGFAHFGIADNIGVQVELLYSTQGTRIDADAFGVQFELKDRLNYLAIPVLFKFTSSGGLTAEIGPSFNILLAANRTIETPSVTGTLTEEMDVKEVYSGLDVMLAIGLGYELPSGLSFNGRFSFSVANVYDEDQTDPADEEAFNTLFQLGVGFPVFGN